MIVARQSTARTVTVGPILDADGAAVTDGVVGDLKLSKNGGAPAALNGSATLTHRHTGFYSLALTTSDLDTVGTAEVTIDDTTNVMPLKEITVMEEASYDALFASSAPGYVANAPVNVAQWDGSAVATPTVAGVPEVDITHIAGSVVTTGDDDILYTGTAQAGSSTTITLDAGASATNDLYKYLTVSLTGGTGANQGNRVITAYNGTTKVATVFPAWTTNPASDTTFALSSGGGLVQAYVAEGVWNAVRSSYNTASTFGQGVASVQGNVTGTIAGVADDAITAGSFSPGAITSTAFAAGAITATVIADNAIDAATFAADVDAEILSYLVDDATRIDASALNTASVTSIPAILADTGTDGVVVAAASKTGYALSTAGLAAFFTSDSGSTYASAVAGSVVKEVADNAGGSSLTEAGIAETVAEYMFSHDTGLTYAGADANSVVKQIADNAGGSALTEAGIADAVLDELLSGHTTAGSLGKAVADVQADTENIQTRLPAALTAGGNIKADVLAISGSTNAADNASTVYDLDFATNYDTSNDRWRVDTIAVGGDSGSVGVLNNFLAEYNVGTITTNITGNLSGSVGSVTGGINTSGGTITTLDALDTAQDAQHATTQGAVAAVPTAAEILAAGDVDGFSLEETLKLCLAALAGKLSGAATTTVTIRAADDSKARLTATVDADGNRTAVTLDAAG